MKRANPITLPGPLGHKQFASFLAKQQSPDIVKKPKETDGNRRDDGGSKADEDDDGKAEDEDDDDVDLGLLNFYRHLPSYSAVDLLRLRQFLSSARSARKLS